jgi:hypothetical protein
VVESLTSYQSGPPFRAAQARDRPVILTAMGRWGGVRWGRTILVGFALIVINLPYGLHQWSLHRAATDGIRVTATVVGVTGVGDDSVVAFRLPRDVDDEQEVRTVKVNRAVGQEATRTRELDVRVLEGHPDVVHVDGQVRGWGGLILTAVADALVVLMLLLSWRLGGRLKRPTLVGVAVEDVRTGDEGSLLDKQDDGTYVINGQVARIGPSSLVLTLRDREVEIHLREHENPISIGERARVRAQLVG